jgi:tripartite-type tricarboxylate transporter receptor subunit TctC
VINIVDPDVVVLGGGLSQIDELYRRAAAAAREYVFSDRCDTPVVKEPPRRRLRRARRGLALAGAGSGIALPSRADALGRIGRRPRPRDPPSRPRSPVTRLFRLIALSLLGLAGLAQHALAADPYPTRPIKWIVPYPPAGTTDVLARIIAQYLTEKLGQSVDRREQAGRRQQPRHRGRAHAPPDGYTMLLVNPAHGINATLYKNLNFNFIRDVAPVAGLVRTPNVMEVTPSFPAKTVAEFIAYCKANPKKINMASSGSGTSVHMSGELFKSMTGCDMLHVPYKGAGPALVDLMGGQVHVLFDNLPSSIGHIKSGKLRRSPSPRRSASRRCRAFRRSARRCPATRRPPGSASACRRTRRARSSTGSTPRSTAPSPTRRSASASPSSAASRSPARPRTSARSSPPRPRSGRRW